MSKDSSEHTAEQKKVIKPKQVPWNPWLGVLFAIIIFIGAQFFAELLLSLGPILAGWSNTRVIWWLNHALESKIIFFAIYGALVVVSLHFFLKWQGSNFRAIGMRRPKITDPLYSLGALPVYILLFVFITVIAKALVPSLDLNQAQELGFNGHYNGFQLVFIGLALVVIAPITEELVFRGLLYGSLKKAMPVILAAIATSLLFAAGHLTESSSGLLYIAGIDTMTLSLILIFLREASGGLWAPIGLHALKNSIAFISIFVLHAH